MRINRVEKLSKGRIEVCLENGNHFVVYRREVRELELEPEAELSQEEYDTVCREILIPRARKRALHLLEQMDRTEAGLRQKLTQNKYPPEIVENAIEYVKSFHYIDDSRFAENYVRYHSETSSKRQLAQKLKQKGVGRDETQAAIESTYGQEPETEKIKRWMEKKHYDPQEADQNEKRRMYQFLLRRGFSSGDICSLL